MPKLKNEELGRLTVEEFHNSDKTPMIIILDDIRSLNNIGSVFRTSDAFRVAKIYLCGITAQPPHKDIRRTALGATEAVLWEYRENCIDLIKELNEQGIKTIAIEQATDAIELKELPVSNKDSIAIVMGNEVKGVSQEVVDACTYTCELAQYGTKHSLNIAVCTGIVIHELFYKLKT